MPLQLCQLITSLNGTTEAPEEVTTATPTTFLPQACLELQERRVFTVVYFTDGASVRSNCVQEVSNVVVHVTRHAAGKGHLGRRRRQRLPKSCGMSVT
jgi:hypothetical protein